MSGWMKRLIRAKRVCQVCKENKLPEEPAVIRLKVLEGGTTDVKICDECANFFDKSADVLLSKDRRHANKENTDDDTV